MNISRRKFVTRLSGYSAAMTLLPIVIIEGNQTGTSDSVQRSPKGPGTGLVLDERYLRYSAGEFHPESPERLIAIKKRLEKSNLLKKTGIITPNGNPQEYIHAVHPQSHIDMIKVYEKDLNIPELAVAGVLNAVDAVCRGSARNAFCAVRPPGHHASDRGFAGFCFYNNVAIAARYAQMKYNMNKVLIIDWDYHHGNGTEWAFYNDPSVLFFSTHALYAYPKTGQPEKTGEGAGKGYNINVPLRHNAEDTDIIRAFKERLLPAAEMFKPDIVFISAGFDSRINDVLGDFRITDDGFIELTKMVMSIAERFSGSRIISVLEGGYNPEGLALAVEAHVNTLTGA